MSRDGVISAASLITAVYIIISSLTYGLFFYRGGTPELGMGGYLLDAFILGLMVFGLTEGSSNSDRATAVVFGTILFLAADVLMKVFFIYPLIGKLFG